MSHCSPEKTLIILTAADVGDSIGMDDSDAPRRQMTDLFGEEPQFSQNSNKNMFKQ